MRQPMVKFTNLYKPGRIGNLKIKNRIMLAPMVTDYINEDGTISDRLIDYYVERAKGGAGLIAVESCRVHTPEAPHRILLTSDRAIPGLRRLVKAIHEAGAKVICEVNPHGGRAEKVDPASASSVQHPFTGVVPRQLSVDDIKKIEEEFRAGVRRVKESGFDGIMIHGCTGYLVAEFLSPRINKRTDEYGGDPKRRARFALELVKVTREVVGPDYPVTFRLMADEKVEGGFGQKDAIELCKMLQEGGIDAVHISAGAQEAPEWYCPPTYMPPGCNADLSQAIKRELKIAVSIAGKINDPYIAEDILKEEKADFVDLGRTLLADPYFPEKAMEGRVGDICRCIGCQRCSTTIIQEFIPLHCTVNPALGREKEFEKKLKPAEKKKRVLVIGGGPGGMEAAIIAKQRGHDVALWEASDRLGGQLNLAVIPPGKTDLGNLLDYLKGQLERLNVVVKLQKKATPAAIAEFAPEVVVVGVGSTPFVPDIPGIDSDNVTNSREVLSGAKDVGNRVVIIGGGSIGCETGDFLAEKGKGVVVTFPEAAPMSLEVVDWSIRKMLLERLEKKKVKIMAGVKQFEEITQKGMALTNKEGNKVFLEADSIVLAAGARPDKTLVQSLKGRVPELYEVGDCVEARRLLEAIHEGAEAALKL